MQHLFFHGPSGAGKSFAIARAAAEAGVTPAGFRSRKAADGAVYLGPAAGPFPLDAAHRVANVAVRPPVCDAARFDALGTALLASVRSGDFVLMETKCLLAYPRWLIDFLCDNKIYKTSFSKYGTVYTDYILPALAKDNHKEKEVCSA